ncbi:copper resistance protein CopZ [Gillisia sp. Hel_I_86]|uniref:copper resistance protein CopZ n=1 Tax=Gillisia sp. Hel_I_86 TaxID=1249981 RepID=UPI00119D00ED|nr:copper resistance protein CopZ [Gillisia sp. Hel_I_86]
MKQKFQIKHISCGGCIARVKKIPEEHLKIEKAEILTAPKGTALITMNEALSVTKL